MKEYVKIICIIDKSGSMSSIKNSAIKGFNDFLEEQKSFDGNATISLTLFDTYFQKVYENNDIKNAEYLNENNYIPDGMTALYDCVGNEINNHIDMLSQMSKEERPSKTMFIIISDGQENSSTKYSSSLLKEMIDEQKKSFGSEFVFLAADENSMLDAKNIGVSNGNTLSYTASSAGIKAAYTTLSKATKTYRSSVVQDKVDTENLFEEKK